LKGQGDSTHTCSSPTPTVDGCDVTLPTRTQTSEEDHSESASDTQTSNRNTVAFRKARLKFFQGHNRRHLCNTPMTFANLLKTENLVCSGMSRKKTALGNLQLWFNYCLFCKAIAISM